MNGYTSKANAKSQDQDADVPHVTSSTSVRAARRYKMEEHKSIWRLQQVCPIHVGWHSLFWHLSTLPINEKPYITYPALDLIEHCVPVTVMYLADCRVITATLTATGDPQYVYHGYDVTGFPTQLSNCDRSTCATISFFTASR
jgi:hypothetical protein